MVNLYDLGGEKEETEDNIPESEWWHKHKLIIPGHLGRTAGRGYGMDVHETIDGRADGDAESEKKRIDDGVHHSYRARYETLGL